MLRLRVPGGRPRELIKIRGIDLPFRETLIETATPELERIRTGFHPQSQVNELHAVLDLTGPDVAPRPRRAAATTPWRSTCAR